MNYVNYIPFTPSTETISFTKAYFDFIMDQPKWVVLHGLYSFYYYTAQWQKSNKIWATDKFVMKKMGMAKETFYKRKKELVALGLIETVKTRKESSGHFGKVYIQVNIVVEYLKTTESTGSPSRRGTGSDKCPVDQGDNMLIKENNIYAYSNTTRNTRNIRKKEENNTYAQNRKNSKTSQKELVQTILPKHFEKFWAIYPERKGYGKGKAKKAWEELCKQKDKPVWKELRKALNAQKKSELWQQEPKYVPHAAKWLTEERWLDDAKELKVFNKGKQSPGYFGDGVAFESKKKETI